MIEDRYNMTVGQNIEVAKRLMVDSVWKSTVFEGFAVTFPETSEIFDGRVSGNMQLETVITINNLKRAWEFILDRIDYPVDFDFICHVNRVVGGDNLIRKAGYLRVMGENVRIGGTSWKPTIPSKQILENTLLEIQASKMSATEKALRIMAFLMRSQAFIDGNKRTAILIANQILIQHGVGILQVEIENGLAFKTRLIDFYETNDTDSFISYVYDTCLYGEINENERESYYEDDDLEWEI